MPATKQILAAGLKPKEAQRLTIALIYWYAIKRRDLPWRRKPYCDDPYCIYVSEIMLQQTQVKTVIPYWERWMRELPTIHALANAPADRVLKLWEGLGYYSRARNLQKAAQQIVAKYGGVFPRSFEAILELPGIGRYTAGAIASIAFGQPTPIVDGNVARVLTRIFGIRGDPKGGDTRTALWEMAARLVQAAETFKACGDLNESLMELGATVCLPREPRCNACPLQGGCFARIYNRIAEFPQIAARPRSTQRTFRAALVRRNGKILMTKRPDGVVNSGFWELPNIEAEAETAEQSFLKLFGGEVKIKRLCDVKHTITRYRLTLELFEVVGTPLTCCKWLRVNALESLPLVNAHRRALTRAGVLQPLRERTGKILMEKRKTRARL